MRGIDGPADITDSSLTERAYRRLEEMIATAVLPPGAILSEASLSQRLGIGRTPIREALQRLAREKLVTVLPRRGIMVSEVNVRTQLRLLEMRREIERFIARTAARRATPEERARLLEIAAGMDAAAAAGDRIAFMRRDGELNALSMAAARNEFAEAAMAAMAGLSRRFWFIHQRQVADLGPTAGLHAEVARAIAAGDEAAAAAAADRLMDYVEAFTRTTIEADS